MKDYGARRRIFDALRAAGAVLVRERKHYVYRLPNGQTFSVSATPSCARDESNTLARLKRAVGGARPAARSAARRREKPGRADGERWSVGGQAAPSLQDALAQFRKGRKP